MFEIVLSVWVVIVVSCENGYGVDVAVCACFGEDAREAAVVGSIEGFAQLEVEYWVMGRPGCIFKTWYCRWRAATGETV